MRLVARNEPLTEEALARLEGEEGKLHELIVGKAYADFARGLADGPFAGLRVEVNQFIAARSWGAWV